MTCLSGLTLTRIRYRAVDRAARLGAGDSLLVPRHACYAAVRSGLARRPSASSLRAPGGGGYAHKKPSSDRRCFSLDHLQRLDARPPVAISALAAVSRSFPALALHELCCRPLSRLWCRGRARRPSHVLGAPAVRRRIPGAINLIVELARAASLCSRAGHRPSRPIVLAALMPTRLFSRRTRSGSWSGVRPAALPARLRLRRVRDHFLRRHPSCDLGHHRVLAPITAFSDGDLWLSSGFVGVSLFVAVLLSFRSVRSRSAFRRFSSGQPTAFTWSITTLALMPSVITAHTLGCAKHDGWKQNSIDWFSGSYRRPRSQPPGWRGTADAPPPRALYSLPSRARRPSEQGDGD